MRIPRRHLEEEYLDGNLVSARWRHIRSVTMAVEVAADEFDVFEYFSYTWGNDWDCFGIKFSSTLEVMKTGKMSLSNWLVI